MVVVTLAGMRRCAAVRRPRAPMLWACSHMLPQLTRSAGSSARCEFSSRPARTWLAGGWPAARRRQLCSCPLAVPAHRCIASSADRADAADQAGAHWRGRAAVADTIYQVSSGLGRRSHGGARAAGVAVLRVSGPLCAHVCRQLTGRQQLPPPRRATLRTLYRDASDGPAGAKETLDKGMVIWMPGPASFTGEDVLELHVHGNQVVVEALLQAIQAAQPGSGSSEQGPRLRLAAAGEFTQRAFLHGKLDLTQVEGLADLLAAETERQRQQAVRQLDGALGRQVDKWRQELVRALAYLEALIDFAEEEDDISEEYILDSVLPAVRALASSLSRALHSAQRGELVRDAIKVAIVGAPNAGKSSLLNALAGRDVAIVHEMPGTTRDVVEVGLDLRGYAFRVWDTAGLRDQVADAVEAEGIRRTRLRVGEAHLRVLALDAARCLSAAARAAPNLPPMTDWAPSELLPLTSHNTLLVFNKADLLEAGATAGSSCSPSSSRSDWLCSLHRALGLPPPLAPRSHPAALHAAHGISSCLVSALDPDDVGFEDLLRCLESHAGALLEGMHKKEDGAAGEDHVVITRERQRQHLHRCLGQLQAFLQLMAPTNATGEPASPAGEVVLGAQLLRIAQTELAALVGAVHVEELLDVIFQDFCIGK
eukprot:g8710.t1